MIRKPLIVLVCLLVVSLGLNADKKGQDCVGNVSAEITKIAGEIYGSVLIEYFPKGGVGSSYDDIYKFHYEWVVGNGDWFSSWCWRMYSCTSPAHIPSRVGIRPWQPEKVKVSIEKAIKIFHSLNCGDKFIGEISLYWPVTPQCPEPFYTFTSNTHCIIHIGAFTGKVTGN